MPPDQRSDTGTTISTTRKSREMLYRSDYDRSMIQTTGVASGYILDGLTRPRVGPPSGFTFCLPLTLVALRAPSVSGKQKAKPDRSRAIKTGHLDVLATGVSNHAMAQQQGCRAPRSWPHARPSPVAVAGPSANR